MELSLRTSGTSYVVCDVEANGWHTQDELPQVTLTLTPRDTEYDPIQIDLSLNSWLEMIAKVTTELLWKE